MAVDGKGKKRVRYGLGKEKRPLISDFQQKTTELQSDNIHIDKGTQTSPAPLREKDEKIKVECENCKKMREQMEKKTEIDKKKSRYSPPKDMIDPNFRFKLFNDVKDTFSSYPFIKERTEELKVEVWTKEIIKSVYNNFKDILNQQLSTVCKRSYLSNIFEESSYVGTCFLMDIFKAVVEEDDKNTDKDILLCVSRQQFQLNMQDPCSPIILDFPGTEPKEDTKVSPPFLVVGILIASYGYNLCACLPLELKDKYITLDILCSRQGSKGIGSLLMDIMLLNAYEKGYTMIGLQVASSNYKALTSKKIRRGTNIEACLFYESFGFFYDTRPRDQWFCFDPESSEMTTMMLDMEKFNKAELLELCKVRLSKDGAMIPEKNLVVPAPPVEKKPMQPQEWNGRRVAREREARKEETISRKRIREEEEIEEDRDAVRRETKKIKKGDGRKIDKVLSSLKVILADGVPRSAKDLLHILSSPPYSIDFIAEKPLNTLTSILSKETIHFKKTTIARVPNSLPILYTLKEFLQSPKSKAKTIEESMELKNSRDSFSLEIPALLSPPTIVNNSIPLVSQNNSLMSPGTPTEPPAPLFENLDFGSPTGLRFQSTPPDVTGSNLQGETKYSNASPAQFNIL